MIPDNILLATDFSETASLLIETLPDLKRVGARRVTLFHAMDVRKTKEGLMNLKTHFQEKLEDEKKKIVEKGFEVETVLTRGYPEEKIVERARQDDSLILIASHGKGYIKKYFWAVLLMM